MNAFHMFTKLVEILAPSSRGMFKGLLEEEEPEGEEEEEGEKGEGGEDKDKEGE